MGSFPHELAGYLGNRHAIQAAAQDFAFLRRQCWFIQKALLTAGGQQRPPQRARHAAQPIGQGGRNVDMALCDPAYALDQQLCILGLAEEAIGTSGQ